MPLRFRFLDGTWRTKARICTFFKGLREMTTHIRVQRSTPIGGSATRTGRLLAYPWRGKRPIGKVGVEHFHPEVRLREFRRMPISADRRNSSDYSLRVPVLHVMRGWGSVRYTAGGTEAHPIEGMRAEMRKRGAGVISRPRTKEAVPLRRPLMDAIAGPAMAQLCSEEEFHHTLHHTVSLFLRDREGSATYCCRENATNSTRPPLA